MAAKDSFDRRRKLGYGSERSYLANLDYGSLEQTVGMMLNAYWPSNEVSKKIEGLILRFVREFQRITTHFKNPDALSDFYEACKNRFQDLTQLNGVIITDASQMEEVNVFVKLESGLQNFSGRWDRRHHVYALASDEEIYDLWSISERPGCYKYLFLADLQIISWAAEISLTDPILGEEAWEQAAWYSTIVCSIGKLYEDIRPMKSYVIETEKKFLDRLKAEHSLDCASQHYQSLMRVIEDIKEGTKPYIRDISSAIRRADFEGNKQFTFQDYHISMRKTGTRLNNKSYPGIYSALIEVDQPDGVTLMFDNYVGYVTHYNRSPAVGLDQPGGKTITIEQHKLDRRGIHMGDNPRQDRLNYVHRRLQRMLDFIPEDCTRDQTRGIEFARKVTDPAYRAVRKNNVYSLDISKATDTIDLKFQELCLRAVLPKEIVDYWLDVNTDYRTFFTVDGQQIRYRQLCGQAQGYKSSFPSFAWCHHMIMRMLMHEAGMEDKRAIDFYRVLGDDSVISCQDPDEKILDLYIDICQWINWSTNRSKGYIAHSHDLYAFAEFAKKRVLNGRVNTPIPSKLILNAEKSSNGTIALFQWISQNYKELSLVDVWADSVKLSSMYSESEIQQISWMAKSGILPCFEGWSESNLANTRDYSVEDLVTIALSYFTVKLKSTLIDSMMPDVFRNVTEGGFDPGKLSYLMNTEDEKKLFDLAKDPDNKYYQLVQANSDMIDYINHLLFNDRPEPMSLSWIELGMSLTSDEESRIFRCLEILDNVNHGIPPADAMTAYLNLSEAIRILTRFNPRGDARVAYLNGTLWTAVLQNMHDLMRSFYEVRSNN